MREFTEKHHAFIVGSFYSLLTERFAQRGEAAFVHATQRYAEPPESALIAARDAAALPASPKAL